MMQFQIVLVMISNIKTRRQMSEFQYRFKNSGLQLYSKEIPTQVFSCDESQIFKNTYFEKYLRMAASENLSGATNLFFRRSFRVLFLLDI